MRVGVLGAGAIGTWVGVRLSAAGVRVDLVGRPWLVAQAQESPLRAVSITGDEARAADDLGLHLEPEALREADIVLVCVKSRHTDGVAAQLADIVREGVPVASLQNGLRNPDRLRRAGLDAVPGMVSFNVFQDGSRFVQATSGPLVLGTPPPNARDALARFAEVCRAGGIEFRTREDIAAVQAGKLLLNLNNGICALAGVSIADSIASRELRRAFAACIREGLEILRAADRPIARVGPLHPRLVARMLALPDGLVRVLARPMIRIDPRARSSTLQDLEAGKPTEIDDLNGELVAIAREAGVPSPANAWVVDQIHALETEGEARRHRTAAEIVAGTVGAQS